MIVYGGKVKGCRILLVLAERCISLIENAVEKKGYDTNTKTTYIITETCGEFS